MEDQILRQTTEQQEDINGEELSEEKKALFTEMAKAGIFYGRKKSKTHPKMKKYIYATRNGIEVIDISQTFACLEAAAEFLKSVLSDKENQILVVGTQPSLRNTVEEFAKRHKFLYVTERWIGGSLTNFKVIHGRIDYFNKITADKEAGRLDKYTKKERLSIDREIEKMRTIFEGVKGIKNLPKALVVVDSSLHETAIREARRSGIPVVVFMNTDGNPDDIEYPIPANTNSRASIEWLLSYFDQAISINQQ
ncbi:MAG: 30S ribosomal protein S2 [Parcubacteria group bacterium]|nr:30S ribosomal protein S2 [Parcubacteria group bacterium]